MSLFYDGALFFAVFIFTVAYLLYHLAKPDNNLAQTGDQKDKSCSRNSQGNRSIAGVFTVGLW